MVSTGMKCIKYLLFLFNLATFVAGLVLIAVGALVQTAFKEYFAFFDGHVNSAAILLIAIGGIVFILGFFGCCGAYKENHFMIITFAVILAVVFILELSAAVAAFAMRYEIGDVVHGKMISATIDYQKAGIKMTWDKTQETLHCCGSSNYSDWTLNEEFNRTMSVPQSCCINASNPQCGLDILKTQNTVNIYTTGCTDLVLQWAYHNILIIGGVALAFSFLQLNCCVLIFLFFVKIVGIILSCCLASALRREYTAV